jgi:hypothetical protein
MPQSLPEFAHSPALQRLLSRAASINSYYERDFDISFSSLFLAFLCSDDPVSLWFQAYIKKAKINRNSILKERRLSPQILEEIARTLPPTPRSLRLTTSAQRYLQAADQLRHRLGARDLDVSHLLAVFIYRPWVHEKDLERWGFRRASWSNAFLELMRSLAPEELEFWTTLHREAFRSEPEIKKP